MVTFPQVDQDARKELLTAIWNARRAGMAYFPTRTQIEYKVVEGVDYQRLNCSVNEAIEKGWVITDSPLLVQGDYFYREMIRVRTVPE
jgi:hypothetical protein